MHQESSLKKLFLLVAAFCLILLPGSAAHAQQFDLSFGVSGLTGPSSTATLQTIGGGAYPSFGMDFLFFHNVGVGFNAAFRAHENLYQGFQPFRPFFYDVDAVYAPPLGKRAQAELSAGIGASSVRFYTPFLTCEAPPWERCSPRSVSAVPLLWRERRSWQAAPHNRSAAVGDPAPGAPEAKPRAEQALLEDLAVANRILTTELAILDIQGVKLE